MRRCGQGVRGRKRVCEVLISWREDLPGLIRAVTVACLLRTVRPSERYSETSRAAELEGPEILVPVPIRHVRILCLPLSQFEQVVLRNPALPRAVPQVGPLLPWKPFPLNFRHSSTSQDKRS